MITVIRTKRELSPPVAPEGVPVGMTPPTVPVGMTPTVPVEMISGVVPPTAPDEVKDVMVGLTVNEEQELVMLHDESFKLS